jgi:hypothetical protein
MSGLLQVVAGGFGDMWIATHSCLTIPDILLSPVSQHGKRRRNVFQPSVKNRRGVQNYQKGCLPCSRVVLLKDLGQLEEGKPDSIVMKRHVTGL